MNKSEFESLFNSIWRKTNPSSPIDISQDSEEVWWLYSQVQSISPKTVVEIGPSCGGTTKIWESLLTADGMIIAIDVSRVRERDTGFWNFEEEAKAEVILLEEHDSQEPATVEAVRVILGDRPIDFLYIDGDHSYEGVKKDYELWTPLVQPGGIVGFHDTKHPPIKQMLTEKGHSNLRFMETIYGTGAIIGW